MNGDHEKPSTSSGSDDTQESPNGSSETNQAEGANGVPGDHEDGNSSNPSPPEENFTKVGKWLTSIEDDVLFYSSEFKSTVVQWLTERLRSTETQSTEAKPEPPQSPTTREERPRAIYWWQRGAHGSPAESGSSSSDEQRKTAPLYWWQRPKGLRSPSSAHSSSSPDKSDADVSMVAELENLNIYDKPNRLEHSEVPNRMNKNMWSSFESDIIEIPQSLLLKCKPPQPRRHSENWDDEEDVPVFFFVKRRRSSGRVSRKSVLTYDRKSRSFEELCLSFDSSPSTEPLSEQLQRTAQGESPSMHRSFVSEDDLLHRIASRGYRIYYRWLCVWYRIRREYKHVSAGIRKLNKENR